MLDVLRIELDELVGYADSLRMAHQQPIEFART